jgi:hypothetical protein
MKTFTLVNELTQTTVEYIEFENGDGFTCMEKSTYDEMQAQQLGGN